VIYDFPDPNLPEVNGLSEPLQADRPLFMMTFWETGELLVAGGTIVFLGLVKEDPIVKQGVIQGSYQNRSLRLHLPRLGTGAITHNPQHSRKLGWIGFFSKFQGNRNTPNQKESSDNETFFTIYIDFNEHYAPAP
jgi:hypothetical protein